MPVGCTPWSFYRRTLILSMVWLAAGPSIVRACPYSIRDSAFLDDDDSSSILVCFVVKNDTPGRSELVEWVSLAAGAWLSDTHVVAEVVNLDRPAEHMHGELLREKFADAAKFPIAVLVSPKQDVLEVPFVRKGKPSLDWVMGVMASTVESPARDELRKHMVTSWCTVLLIEGKDPAENARAHQAIVAAGKRITGTITELDKVVSHGPHVIVVSPKNPAERVLLWSLGLTGKADDPVRAAMVVGRGELRGPVLAGKKLTEQNLFESFEMLGRSCSCTTAEMWLSGPRIPLAWSRQMDEAVEEELGFDLDDPAAISSIRGATGGATGGESASAGLGIGGIGYRETLFMPESESADDAAALASTATPRADDEGVEPSDLIPVAPAQASPTTTTPMSQRTVGVMIALGLVAMAIATAIIVRRGRSATQSVTGESPSGI